MGLLLDVLWEQAVHLQHGQWGTGVELTHDPGKQLLIKYWRGMATLRIEVINGAGTPAGTPSQDDDLAPCLMASHMPLLLDPLTGKSYSVESRPESVNVAQLVQHAAQLHSFTRLRALANELSSLPVVRQQSNINLDWPAQFDVHALMALNINFLRPGFGPGAAPLTLQCSVHRQTGRFLISTDQSTEGSLK